MNTAVADNKPQIEEIKDYSPFHQRITLGPFERGYGHTLGNALRRILLSSVPGFAATSVKIEGVEHQYSTITGVAEDVIDMILNIKGIAFRIEGSDRAVVKLAVDQAGVVTAGDLSLPGQVTVINPEHYIASLSKGAKLNMEITIEGGTGYLPAPIATTTKGYGTISIDAAFSPVRNVGIEVESTRVDSRTDLDRLIIDLKTNGVHTPEQMIRYAAKLLIEQLSMFAELDSATANIGKIGARVTEQAGDRFYEPIDVLGINVRYVNNLKQENIFFVGELVTMSEKELLNIPRLGKKSIDEIKIALAEIDLTLGMDIGKFEPDKEART